MNRVSINWTLVSLVLFIVAAIDNVNANKNCSFVNEKTHRTTYVICDKEMICCEKPETVHEVCCNPPEYQHFSKVLPVKLTVKNLVLIVVVFFGVIIIGAVFVLLLIGISNMVEEKESRQLPPPRYHQIGSLPNYKSPWYYERPQPTI